MRIWGDSSHCFLYMQYKLQLVFQSLAELIVWLQWCTFGHASHDHRKKNSQTWLQFTVSFHVMHMNVLTFYSVTIYFFIFPGTVQLCSSVFFLWRMYWNPVPVVGGCIRYFQYAFHFNQSNVILLSPVEGWWWSFRILEFYKTVTIVIIFSHHNTKPPFPIICPDNIVVQGNVILCNMSRSWILP
jgi:hypothetical protein